MRLSDLLGSEVCTESGEKLAHVWDVRAEAVDGGYRLVGLLVGRSALFERLGLKGWRAAREHGEKTRPNVDVVPWDAVLRIEHGLIVVRDGTEPQRK